MMMKNFCRVEVFCDVGLDRRVHETCTKMLQRIPKTVLVCIFLPFKVLESCTKMFERILKTALAYSPSPRPSFVRALSSFLGPSSEVVGSSSSWARNFKFLQFLNCRT
uniref:Uncharacterized protein n=1 Tax=Cacopsylla melanoneura TaxID=428564 RepID=A0A8D9AWZ7_9HEMI